MKIGILGGGLTALTIASELNIDYEILEKEKECGGLCRSIIKKGFTFDQGGHILYSKDKETLNWMLNQLKENKHKRKRNNRVFVKGKKIKYPFENDLAGLPLADNMKCLYHYLFNPNKKPSNFKEWIYYTFGKGIADVYLVPYNEKIWNYKPEKMSMHWVEGRVPKPPKIDVVKSSLGINTEGYKHQLYFYYPKKGGINSLINVLESKAKLITKDFDVKKIEKKEEWIVSDGKTKKKFDKLISTIPVMDLVKSLENVPKKVKEAVQDLKFNSLIVVMLGVDAANISDITGLYVPTKRVGFHRVCFMNRFSENCAPKGKSALIAEYTVNKGDRFDRMDNKEIIKHTINGLDKLGIISKKDVVHKDVFRTKYAYVVYDLDYKKNIKIVRNYFDKIGIELCGRFAEFEYLNMDACVRKARELSKRLNNEKR